MGKEKGCMQGYFDMCHNFSHLPVTVPEDEIWQRDAAVGEYPVPCGNGKTDKTVFSDTVHCSGQSWMLYLT